jgi:hypothetical protein
VTRRTSRRRHPKPNGRPPLLNDELQNTICGHLETGNYLATAAELSGVSRAAVYNWLARGNDALHDTHTTGTPIPETEHRYVKFVDAVAHAQARAENTAVKSIDKVIRGGFVLVERPVIGPDGLVVLGPDGEPVVERTLAPPDGKLALEVLGRKFPDRWGRRETARVELSGPDGGSVQVESSVVVSAVAERLVAVRAARAGDVAQLPPGDDGVVEGELVDGGDEG